MKAVVARVPDVILLPLIWTPEMVVPFASAEPASVPGIIHIPFILTSEMVVARASAEPAREPDVILLPLILTSERLVPLISALPGRVPAVIAFPLIFTRGVARFPRSCAAAISPSISEPLTLVFVKEPVINDASINPDVILYPLILQEASIVVFLIRADPFNVRMLILPPSIRTPEISVLVLNALPSKVFCIILSPLIRTERSISVPIASLSPFIEFSSISAPPILTPIGILPVRVLPFNVPVLTVLPSISVGVVIRPTIFPPEISPTILDAAIGANIVPTI